MDRNNEVSGPEQQRTPYPSQIQIHVVGIKGWDQGRHMLHRCDIIKTGDLIWVFRVNIN